MQLLLYASLVMHAWPFGIKSWPRIRKKTMLKRSQGVNMVETKRLSISPIPIKLFVNKRRCLLLDPSVCLCAAVFNTTLPSKFKPQ